MNDCGPAYEHYGRKKYLIKIVNLWITQQRIANGETNTLEILYEDLESFFRKEDEKEMVNDFRVNTIRNTKIFT